MQCAPLKAKKFNCFPELMIEQSLRYSHPHFTHPIATTLPSCPSLTMAYQKGLQGLNPPPLSNNTVRVRMIDTSSIMSLDASSFVDPVMPGHEVMSVVTVAFLIENERLGKKAMFDLGTRKDYWNCPPFTLKRIEQAIPGIRIDKGVTEILVEKGVGLNEIGEFDSAP